MPTFQVIINQDWNGEPIQNTLYFEVQGGGTGDFAALGTILDSLYFLTVNERDQNWEIVDYSMRVVDGSGTPFITIPSTGVVGTLASENMPTGNSVVSFHQALAGEPNRSWNHHGGWGEGSNTQAGLVSAGTLAEILGLMQNLLLITAINGKPASWVVARLSKTDPQTVLAFRELAIVSVSAIWRYLKSRSGR